jgi:hypothetical protein
MKTSNESVSGLRISSCPRCSYQLRMTLFHKKTLIGITVSNGILLEYILITPSSMTLKCICIYMCIYMFR